MADQSESTPFRTRFESALQNYQQTTGVTLAEHPVTSHIQNLQSLESITNILKYEARASSDVLGSDKILHLIESTASMLFALSAVASFGDTATMVRKEN